MDKATAIKIGVVSVGALALYYLLRNPTAGDTEATDISDYFGGAPTAAQKMALDNLGLLTPNSYDDIVELPPYYGNNPGNQTEPTAIDKIIDAISRQASGGSGPGCCAGASAPTTFTAPSIQYTPQTPQVISVPAAAPVVKQPSAWELFTAKADAERNAFYSNQAATAKWLYG